MRHVPSGWNAETSKSPPPSAHAPQLREPVLVGDLVAADDHRHDALRAGAEEHVGEDLDAALHAREVVLVHAVGDERHAAGARAHLAAAPVLDHEAERRDVRVALASTSMKRRPTQGIATAVTSSGVDAPSNMMPSRT